LRAFLEFDLKRSADIEDEIKQASQYLSEYEAHLEALETGEPFAPRLTGQGKTTSSGARGTKRKMSRGDRRSKKRRRSQGSDDDYPITISDDSDDVQSDMESGPEGSEEPGESDDDDDASMSETGPNADDDGCEAEEVTVHSLKAKIDHIKEVMTGARERKSQARKDRKAAVDRLAVLKKTLARLQREKNAFCSLKRSEVRYSWRNILGYWSSMPHVSSFLVTSSRKTSEWA
jgi:hypothetical protein